MPFKLSATLKAHSGDVRAVVSPTNELVLSASRDTTAISWHRTAPGAPFSPEHVLRPGSRYINAVAYIPPSPAAPKGYAVTGGLDTVINVFSLDSPKEEPDYSLVGHSENVCALHVSPGGAIISGSWDQTAKVWKDYKLAYELKGHGLSVWAVLALDEDQFLTGSADKSIRLWQQHKTITTFRGHTDAVRGLAVVPDIGFASCSNDSEVRVWTLGGDLVYTLSGHTSYVYSLTVLPGGEIVSGGEDRSVRVWQDGECTQVITHPAISVWTVSSSSNGDIVSGCSDGIVRIFSASEESWVSEGDLKAYDDEVASQALPSTQVGDVKKTDLPGPEALETPGKAPGDIKMIRDGENVDAYQWDGTTNSWTKVGQVVDAVGQGRKQLYAGKEYDYVFDVDIQDGVPPLKLPYNVTENPYTAAQRFLHANELSLNYLDEVVRFIETNTAGVNIGTGGEEYQDPYTGASRYRSSAGTAPAQPQAPASTYMDPYTGASRYSGAPATAAKAPATNVLPSSKVLTFKQVKDVSSMRGKLHELDDALRNEISTSALAMYPDELGSMQDIFTYLSHVSATPPQAAPNSLKSSHIEAIVQVLDKWPSAQCFPVIDLSRLVTGYCANLFSESRTPGLRVKFFQVLFKAAEWNTPWQVPISKSRETNVLLALRALVNSLQDECEPNEAWLTLVISALEHVPYASLGKNQRSAFASVLFNISCVNIHTPIATESQQLFFTITLTVLKGEKTEPEASYRALVALGNTLHGLKSRGTALIPAQSAEIESTIPLIPSLFPADSRIQNIVNEILHLL